MCRSQEPSDETGPEKQAALRIRSVCAVSVGRDVAIQGAVTLSRAGGNYPVEHR